MGEQVRIGLIGCGGIANRHVEWFLAHPDCRIAALCDRSAEAMAGKAKQVAALRPDEPAPALLTDSGALLEHGDIDAVAVLLPHDLHYEVTKAALEAGKHVLVEKPMVETPEEARNRNAAAEARSLVLGIGYQRSTMPEYLCVKQMIERGELGRVRFVSAHLEQSWAKLALGADGTGSWRTDAKQAGGGQLMDCGSHTIGALLHVTGLTPEEVFAYIDTCGLPVDVNTSIAVRFREEAQGAISIGGYGHSVTEVLRVVGEEKSARIFFRTVREQSLEIDGEVVDAHARVAPTTVDAQFVDAVLGRARMEANGDLGLRVAQLTTAAYRSAEAHAPMAVG